MSLLDTASLVVTPNGYKAGTLYSVIPSDGSGDMTVARASDASYTGSNGLIQYALPNVPRLDYSNGGCPSVLIEPQRTNLNLNSSDLSSASYTPGGGAGHSVIITPNYAVSPDGTTNADRVQLTRGSSYAELFQRISGLSGQTVTISFYAKALTGTPTLATVSNNAYVNLITFTNDWVRYEYTYVDDGATSGFNLITWTGLPSTSLTADVLVWGIQLEVGGYATSYTPTTSASVTRIADVISKTGISSLIGQTEGTLFANVDYLENTENTRAIAIQGGVNRIGITVSKNDVGYFIVTSAGIIISTAFSLISTTKKVALSYESGNISLFCNGVLMDSNTLTYTITGSISELYLGQFEFAVGTGQNGQGNKCSALWKINSTNTQLAQLTAL